MRIAMGIAAGLGLALAAPAGAAAPGKTPESTVVGRVVVHEGLRSEELGNSRRLFVLLPPDYERETERRYPVVYAADGQDLFDTALAAGGEEWALDELLAARPPGVAPVVVVGVEAAPHALAEYAPPGSRSDARGDVYRRFLVQQVKPFVEERYRVRTDAASTLVLGEGAGALFALYAAWTAPDVFGAAIALDLPDLDARSTAWCAGEPPDERPRLWFEQRAGEAARPSTTALLATLQRGADVQVVLAGRNSNRIQRVAAALRRMLPNVR